MAGGAVLSKVQIFFENMTNRNKKIIWYNPPFSKNVKTNVAKQFLKLVKNISTKTIDITNYLTKMMLKFHTVVWIT